MFLALFLAGCGGTKAESLEISIENPQEAYDINTEIPVVLTVTPEEAAPSSGGEDALVWIPGTGSKYHSNSSCSNMKNPSQVTIGEAQALGYGACKKCY